MFLSSFFSFDMFLLFMLPDMACDTLTSEGLVNQRQSGTLVNHSNCSNVKRDSSEFQYFRHAVHESS